MRVTHDKNGKPFGHCDDCNGQLRVGGNTYREKKFIERYPFSGQKAPEIPVTVTEQKTPPAESAVPVPVPKPEIKQPPQQKSKFAAALDLLGGV